MNMPIPMFYYFFIGDGHFSYLLRVKKYIHKYIADALPPIKLTPVRLSIKNIFELIWTKLANLVYYNIDSTQPHNMVHHSKY